MFDRLKGVFGRKRSAIRVGHAVKLVNSELNISLYGSLHEVREGAAAASPLRFVELVNHLQTEITIEEIWLKEPVIHWHGGPHAEQLIELMDLTFTGQAKEIARFADVLRSDSDGSQLPLIIAADAGDVDTVDALITAGAAPNRPGDLGLTALHWACGRAHGGIAAALVLAGADRSMPSWFGFSAVDVASMNGNLKLGRKLDPVAVRHPDTDWATLTAQQLRC